MPSLFCLLADARAALAEASRLVAGNGNALYAAQGVRLEGENALAERAAHRQAERAFLSALR